MCKVLALNRSTYYKEFKRKPTKTQISNDELDSKILKVYYDSKRRYGAPKIFKVLRNEVNLRKYKDSKAAYDAIFEYIESWYNRKRIHSSLNYRTPEAVYSECEKLAA